MARDLRLVGAGRTSPDERQMPAEQRRGPQIVLRVVSQDLRSQPVHTIELSREQALETIRQLSSALLAVEP